MNNWISVDDRLPPVGEYVLWVDGNKTMSPYLPQQHIDRIDKRGECLVNYLYNYTRWQPLPPPPMESHEVEDVEELQECLSNLCTAYRMVVGLDGAYDTPLTDAERLLKRLSERHYE